MTQFNEDRWARLFFGGNSMVGSVLLVVYPLLFTLVVGGIFVAFRSSLGGQ